MATSKKTHWYKNLTTANWLTMLGGVLIFGSWMVEKKYQVNWSEQKASLAQSQMVIEITENQRSMYEVAYYNETTKEKLDTQALAYLQQRLTRVYMDLLVWNQSRLSDDTEKYSESVESKRRIDEENRASLDSKDYRKIHTNYNVVTALFGKTYLALDEKFIEKYGIVRSQEEKWATIFFYIYIAGSISLAMSFIMQKSKTHNTNS